MPKVKKYVRGVVDPLSIISVLFLLVTLVVGTAVVNDRGFSLNIAEKASDTGNRCFDECRKEKGRVYCNNLCGININWQGEQVNTSTNTSATGGVTCDANGKQYATGSVVIYGGIGSYATCGSDGKWQVGVGSLTDIKPENVPQYAQTEYQEALADAQSSGGGSKPQPSLTQPEIDIICNVSMKESFCGTGTNNCPSGKYCQIWISNTCDEKIVETTQTCTVSNTGQTVVNTRECNSGSKTCDGSTLKTCSQSGFWISQNCQYGCLNNACISSATTSVEVNRDDDGITRDLTVIIRDENQNVITANTTPITINTQSPTIEKTDAGFIKTVTTVINNADTGEIVNAITQNINTKKKKDGETCSNNSQCESNNCSKSYISGGGTPVFYSEARCLPSFALQDYQITQKNKEDFIVTSAAALVYAAPLTPQLLANLLNIKYVPQILTATDIADNVITGAGCAMGNQESCSYFQSTLFIPAPTGVGNMLLDSVDDFAKTWKAPLSSLDDLATFGSSVMKLDGNDIGGWPVNQFDNFTQEATNVADTMLFAPNYVNPFADIIPETGGALNVNNVVNNLVADSPPDGNYVEIGVSATDVYKGTIPSDIPDGAMGFSNNFLTNNQPVVSPIDGLVNALEASGVNLSFPDVTINNWVNKLTGDISITTLDTALLPNGTPTNLDNVMAQAGNIPSAAVIPDTPNTPANPPLLTRIEDWWDNSPINWNNWDIGLGGSPAIDSTNWSVASLFDSQQPIKYIETDYLEKARARQQNIVIENEIADKIVNGEPGLIFHRLSNPADIKGVSESGIQGNYQIHTPDGRNPRVAYFTLIPPNTITEADIFIDLNVQKKYKIYDARNVDITNSQEFYTNLYNSGYDGVITKGGVNASNANHNFVLFDGTEVTGKVKQVKVVANENITSIPTNPSTEHWFQQNIYSPTDGFLPAAQTWLKEKDNLPKWFGGGGDNGTNFGDDALLVIGGGTYKSLGGQKLVIDPQKDASLRRYLNNTRNYLIENRTDDSISRVNLLNEYVNSSLRYAFPDRGDYYGPTILREDIYSQGSPAYLGQFIDNKTGVCREYAACLHVALADSGKPNYMTIGDVDSVMGVSANQEGGRHAWVEYIDSRTGEWMVADPTNGHVLPRDEAYKTIYVNVQNVEHQVFVWPEGTSIIQRIFKYMTAN